jgi:hypothetical protein
MSPTFSKKLSFRRYITVSGLEGFRHRSAVAFVRLAATPRRFTTMRILKGRFGKLI